MELKKQMEMDLEELEEKLLVLGELSGHDNYVKHWKLSGKRELLEKYLKAFENDMPVEVGREYKVKNKLFINLDYDINNDVEIRGEWNNAATLSDWDPWEIIDIGKGYDGEITYIKLEDSYQQWVYCDLKTFKHFFEEVKDENYNR